MIKLSKSQAEAFTTAGISMEYLKNMVDDARLQGMSDDEIYKTLSYRADALGKVHNIDVQKAVEQKIEQQAEQISATQQLEKKEPLKGFYTTNPDKIPKLKVEVDEDSLVSQLSDRYTAQRQAEEYGKGLSAGEAFLINAGDMSTLSAMDFAFPEAEMVRKGAEESHPIASVAGQATGALALALATGGRSLLAIPFKAAGKAAGLAAVKEGVKDVVKSKGKKALPKVIRGAGIASLAALENTAELAVQDAIRAASKTEEWRTYKNDVSRYTSDFATGLAMNVMFRGGANAWVKYRRGAKAAQDIVGQEILDGANEVAKKIKQAGGTELQQMDARYKYIFENLDDTGRNRFIQASKADKAFRSWLETRLTGIESDVVRSAELMTNKEVNNAVDATVDELLRSQKLGSDHFDTGLSGLAQKTGHENPNYKKHLEDVDKEVALRIGQDPEMSNKMINATREVFSTNKALFPNMVSDLEKFVQPGHFSALSKDPRFMEIAKANPEEGAKMAREYFNKIMTEGTDSIYDIQDLKRLMLNFSKADVAKGSASALGGFRKELNDMILRNENLLGSNFANRYTGILNVEDYFKDSIEPAYELGKKFSASSYQALQDIMDSEIADEKLAKLAGFKMGFLDQIKTAALSQNKVKLDSILRDIDANDNLKIVFGGKEGVTDFLDKIKDEVAVKARLTQMKNAALGLAGDSTLGKEVAGGTVAMATGSPNIVVERLSRIYNANKMPAPVRKELMALVDNPSWSGIRSFFNTTSKDTILNNITHQALKMIVDEDIAADAASKAMAQSYRESYGETPYDAYKLYGE